MSLFKQVMQDSPATYWPLDDASGAPKDRSGNGKDLTVSRGVTTFVTDTVYGRVVDATAGDWTTTFTCPQSAYTMEAWVYENTASPADDACPIGDWGSSGAMIFLPGGGGVPLAYHIGVTLALSIRPAATIWHHYAVTWDGTTRRFYLDGTLNTSTATSAAPGSFSSRVNSYGSGASGRSVTGRMAHTAWYTSALSADRVKSHYEAGRRSAVSV